MPDDAESAAEGSAAGEVPDADLADTPKGAGRKAREAASKKAGKEPATGSGHDGDDGPPKKRWFDRGLVWLALLIVLAVTALAVSFIADQKEPSSADVAAPADISAFCFQAKSLGDAPPLNVEVGSAATPFTERVTILEAMAKEAPAPMAKRINRYKDSLQPIIDAIESPQGEGAEATAALGQVMDEQAQEFGEDASEISDYTLRICGFRPEETAQDVEEPADQAPDPTDPAAFCAAARTFAEAPAPEAPTTGSADAYKAYAATLSTLIPTAPPSIARRIQNIVDSFQIVITAVESGAGAGDQGFDNIATAMDQQEAKATADAEQLQAYVSRICRFDMGEVHRQANPDDSTTTTGDPSTSQDPASTTTTADPSGATQGGG